MESELEKFIRVCEKWGQGKSEAKGRISGRIDGKVEHDYRLEETEDQR